MIKAFFQKIWRDISTPFNSLYHYLRLKKKWHGVVRFDRTNTIGNNSSFEGADSLGARSRFVGKMGYGSYMCEDCNIEGNIGRFTSIGAEVRSSRGVHPMGAPFVSTSPMFFSTRKQAMETFATEDRFEELKSPVEIGNDVWIGVRVFLAGDVKIGDGAIILSGAVITKDVPPYAIVGGVPAKILKYRYDDETIQFLLKSQWWNRPLDWLRENSLLLCDLENFKESFR